ncbi:MAG: AMP-binding protein, partial [Eubacterium sp.]|nr:AMP-binding protein [Eubacterium sp.]
MKNILEFFEHNAARLPDKPAFVDNEESLTYAKALELSKRIGSHICKTGLHNKPVAVYLDKNVRALTAMFGVVYSGNFYVMIDSEMPLDRIERIFATLQPAVILTDSAKLDGAKTLGV